MVPGSFELIHGSKKAQEENPNAVIAIGSVIQGETKHFEFICNSVAQGIKDLNINSKVPVIFCVLTDDNLNQAKERSGGKFGNKGEEAAIAAIKMANFHSKQA
jgi:6,7-dimethyl-8-ribityllumazine synthase